jgi:hypothetical protein
VSLIAGSNSKTIGLLPIEEKKPWSEGRGLLGEGNAHQANAAARLGSTASRTGAWVGATALTAAAFMLARSERNPLAANFLGSSI